MKKTVPMFVLRENRAIWKAFATWMSLVLIVALSGCAQTNGMTGKITENQSANFLHSQEKANSSHGFLGIVLRSLTNGAQVLDVLPDGSAEKAGIQAGDIIVGFNGSPVKDARDLVRKVWEMPVGKTTTLVILRNKRKMKVSAKLTGKPEEYVYCEQGDLYLRKRNYDDAISEYTKAIELNFQWAKVYEGRGRAYLYKSEYNKAISDFTKAIELDPQYARAYANRSTAYEHEGMHEEAISDHKKFVAITARHQADFWYKKACVYASMGDKTNALENLKKAIALDPDYINNKIIKGSPLFGMRTMTYSPKIGQSKAVKFQHVSTTEIAPSRQTETVSSASWVGVTLGTPPLDALGALVQSVTPGSPAEKAGLRKGDVINILGGFYVMAPRDFFEALSRLRGMGINRDYGVQILRAGRILHLAIHLPSHPLASSPCTSAESAGSDKPWIGVEIKNPASNVPGAEVVFPVPGSPAQEAGLRQGDIITGLAGQPVASAHQLVQMVAGLNVGADYQLSIERGGRAMGLTICPVRHALSAMPGSLSPSNGLAGRAAPRKGPLDINVLKYALIDPHTHQVTFIGKYDPAYHTGPIPYADYLSEALGNAYPSFSLEPDQYARAQFLEAAKRLGADIRRMRDPRFCGQWAQKLMSVMIDDPSLSGSADRRRLLDHIAAAFKMKGRDFKRLYDGATKKIKISPGELMALEAKMMQGAGNQDVANGLLAMIIQGTPRDRLQMMARVLDVTRQYQSLEQRGLSERQFLNEGIILCFSEMCRKLGGSERRINTIASQIRAGRRPGRAMIDYMAELMGIYLEKAADEAFNGLVLGPRVIARLYGFPVPQSNLVFKNLASNSLLGDVLFRADYRLKSLDTFPDARRKIPDHLTAEEFAERQARAMGYNMPPDMGADIGDRLVPADVKMRTSPNGTVVEFDDSRIKIVGWVRATFGSVNSTDRRFIRTVLATRYPNYLTEHYDEYAKVYPEWHELSEVAKIVALVRWARKNGYTLKARDPSGATISHPKHIDGFWSAVFEVNGNNPSLTLIAEGGASFARREGEGWVQTQPDVTVTSDVSRQLSASAVLAEQASNAALSGNLEAASALAEKSAEAMTGEIDLSKLPSLGGAPVPQLDPASYAQATGQVIDQATDCMHTMQSAREDLARAKQIEATSPEEARQLAEQATERQDAASARLRQILNDVRTYRDDPSMAGDVVVRLRNNNAVVAPIGTSTSYVTPPRPPAAGNPVPRMPAVGNSKAAAHSPKCAELISELDTVNREIESTRTALLRLNAAIQGNNKLFEEWQEEASQGFNRSINLLANDLIDFGSSTLAKKYKDMYEAAKNLPENEKPSAEVMEQYRMLASLSHLLVNSKQTYGAGDLANRENKTDADIFETMRDGIVELAGVVAGDSIEAETLEYGALLCDTAYNVWDYGSTWKSIQTLGKNNATFAEALRKLTDRMKQLIARQKQLRQEIEAGEPANAIFK